MPAEQNRFIIFLLQYKVKSVIIREVWMIKTSLTNYKICIIFVYDNYRFIIFT